MMAMSYASPTLAGDHAVRYRRHGVTDHNGPKILARLGVVLPAVLRLLGRGTVVVRKAPVNRLLVH